MDFNLKVRVINMWTTPDRGNPTQQGSIHMILVDEKLANDEEDAAYVETVCELATQKQLETIEGVDSSKIAVTVSDVTPTSKSLGKAIAESVESLDDIELGGCDASSTKEPKLRCDSPNKCEVVAVDPVVARTKDSLGKRAADTVVPVVDVD